eukprot:Partr_v1_DN23817_c1_g1_i1_m63685 putative Destroys radicals which are normally produced within the cells and which are toxic to biological systems (By similarity)
MLAKSSIVARSLCSSRALAMQPQKAMIHKLPDLPYDYNELEPVVNAEIMRLHHSKHHNAYVTNLNIALEKLNDAQNKNDITSAITLQPALNFNGGGHINHSIFWTNLCPPKQFQPPTGPLSQAIEKQWGSLQEFQSKFSAASAGVQGSGWGWLGYNKSSGRLEIATTFNQDPLVAARGLEPLLGIDVWEHAYYLQYKNARPDYLKEIWKIINWKNVAERYSAAAAASKK